MVLAPFVRPARASYALYKRLKHGTLVMRFCFLPAWDKAVATAQELKMIRGNFEDRFPAHGRFLESLLSVH